MPSSARTLLTSQPATEREAAAITAAIVQFRRDTAPTPAASVPRRSPWQRAAFLEDTGRAPASPWGDHTPWG